uniref:Tetraspanin 10 n=1 Tax=Malurus cyaneus samueli TaxID=2593467 RepID=A0A8C5X8L2_9PASS
AALGVSVWQWDEQDPGLWYPDPPKLSPFSRCVRCLAFLWNLLFLLLGLLVLAVGVWGLLAKGGAPLGSDPMLLFVLAGLAASAVSLAGCLGAFRASPCLLRFFLGAVLAFGGLQVLGGLLLLLARRRLRDALRDLLLLCLLRYRDDPELQFLADEVQRSLQCCGLESTVTGRATREYFNCSAPGVQACGVPSSCCQDALQNGSVPNAQCGFGVLGLGAAAAGALVHTEAVGPRWVRGCGARPGLSPPGPAVLVLVEAVGALMALRVLGDIGWGTPPPPPSAPPAPDGFWGAPSPQC